MSASTVQQRSISDTNPGSWAAVRTLLEPAVGAGLVSEAWLSLAYRILALHGETDAQVVLGAALALAAPARGSVRASLGAAWPEQEFNETSAEWLRQLPTPGEVFQAMRRSVACAPAGSDRALNAPFVWLAGGEVYAQRFRLLEESIAAQLLNLARVSRPMPQHRRDWFAFATTLRAATGLRGAGPAEVRARASKLQLEGPTGQDVALAVGLTHALLLLTGGPGTGKTTTVRALLSALLLQHEGAQPLRIAVAAPTGKAAARVRESLSAGLDTWQVGMEVALGTEPRAAERIAGIRQALEHQTCVTLHRLLGIRSDALAAPTWHARQPLPWDVVVVDEVSMVDAPMMGALLDALPYDDPGFRLILMGDRHQLASVDVGTVLADLCTAARPAATAAGQLGWHAATLRALAFGPAVAPDSGPSPAPPLAPVLVELQDSYRFGADSPIGRLARAVNENLPTAPLVNWTDRPLADDEAPAVRGLLAQEARSGASGAPASGPVSARLTARAWSPLNHPPLRRELEHGLDGYIQAIRDWRKLPPEALSTALLHEPANPVTQRVNAVFRALDQFRVLVSTRQAAWGVAAWNDELSKLVRGRLQGDRGADAPAEALRRQDVWIGRPIMVLRNDYEQQLFNGDVGILLGRGPDGPRVVFPTAQPGQYRQVALDLLPAHETALAMTVHKSQGSEFGHAFVVLPPVAGPLLTRELVYTALTRARDRVTLYGTPEVLDQACARTITRASGLAQLLDETPALQKSV